MITESNPRDLLSETLPLNINPSNTTARKDLLGILHHSFRYKYVVSVEYSVPDTSALSGNLNKV